MACNTWRARLDLYLDGELPSAELADLTGHLKACPSCTVAVLERVQLKRSLQSAGKRYEARTEFRNKILKSVAAKPRASFRWQWSLAAAAALVLVVAVSLLTYQGRENTARMRLYGELADLHVATLASATPVDVVSTDRHTVKPWFQGKIPFTFNLPELQGSEFSLLGGRLVYLDQTSGAHLIYQIRKHEISVFIVPERGVETSLPAGASNKLSFNYESWTQNGLRYFVVGDSSAIDIQNLSKLLQDAR